MDEPSHSTDRSIAVLPFTDLSPGKDHAYFSDGVAEEILTALAKVDGLRVAARRSSFWFRGKEAELPEIAQGSMCITCSREAFGVTAILFESPRN